MNAHQPRTTPSYAYDITFPLIQGTGRPIFGYDASTNWFIEFNFDLSAGSASKLRQFTAKERDTESGLDYFGARYYGSALGRFTSPDATFLNIRKVFNPQRWNLYEYGVNNPLKFVDPDGNEAIALYYPGYQVGVRGNFTAPLGHAGVVVVDKNGSTHYFEYGRCACGCWGRCRPRHRPKCRPNWGTYARCPTGFIWQHYAGVDEGTSVNAVGYIRKARRGRCSGSEHQRL
jgi:RHS repeat-associated protein